MTNMATRKLGGQKGSAFSMDEVAKLAGVSKQAIYRRWRSKIDLVVEAIESALSDGMTLPAERPDDPVACLEDIAWRHFSKDQAASNRLSIYLQVESFRNETLRDRLVEWRSRFIDVYKQALVEVEDAGRRTSGDIDVQAEILMELISGGTRKLALASATTAADQRQCFDQRWAAFKQIAIRA